MKKLRPNSNTHVRETVCTVSAAALMLGVSQAATVGINFQANYCDAQSISGYIVTSTAFGIDPKGWENLTQMDNGYGSCSGPLFYNLSEVIDTTTSTNGLNPLPNGALSISWGAATANVSGFNGYPGNKGEFQVYHGFLRDGVNFGPGSSGGDNNQPGYNVDIVGLKTVFTNHPFVIQLVASSDSMNTFTNAFIIDASHSTTQSVVYLNPHLESPQGGAPWVRGYGGGISTVSMPVDADHVKIIGNRAAHGGDKTVGDDYNEASNISGIIITDKPVVTMSPQPVVASLHDTVHLKGIAAGVPPLSYQWRKGAVPILNATNATYSIPDIASSGKFDLVVTNLYGAAISKASDVSVDQLAIVPDAAGSGNIIISWQSDAATLLEATNAVGPYTPVAGSPASPYTNSVAPGAKFYRYTRPPQAPVTIESNPYDE